MRNLRCFKEYEKMCNTEPMYLEAEQCDFGSAGHREQPPRALSDVAPCQLWWYPVIFRDRCHIGKLMWEYELAATTHPSRKLNSSDQSSSSWCGCRASLWRLPYPGCFSFFRLTSGLSPFLCPTCFHSPGKAILLHKGSISCCGLSSQDSGTMNNS